MSHATLTQEIEDWLIAEALRDADIVRLFERLCERLKAMGVPLDRAVLNWLTLHPLFRSEHAFWFPGQSARLERRYHATAGSDEYIRSPFYHVQQRGLTSLRRRLDGHGAVLDFEVLQDFVGQGFTDYLLTATFFRIADVTAAGEGRESSGLLASWATKRRGGFADDDLDALQRIQRVLAVACRAAIQQRVMTNLATAYLGPTAGGRVLAGDIRRGDGERITAAIWFSDLRDSTRLSDSMDPDNYLGLLNQYFECTAQPVIEQGGEILNFIGDGVFAIFPVESGDATAAAARAEAAAREARRLCADAMKAAPAGGPPLAFGIGLAIGSITFGNIGVPSRLAFSGIGHVVNRVHRVEAATKRIGRPVLATRDFAAVAPGAWQSAGHVEGSEFAEPVEVFALADEGSAAAKAAE